MKAAADLCKQFRPRSGPTEHLTLWICFWKIFKKLILKKKSQQMKTKAWKITQHGKSYGLFTGLQSIQWRNFINWAATWDFQQCGMCNLQRLRSAWAYTQSDQSLCLSLAYSTSGKLLTEHHLELLILKAGCTGVSEYILVKLSHCWKSYVAAHILHACLSWFTAKSTIFHSYTELFLGWTSTK